MRPRLLPDVTTPVHWVRAVVKCGSTMLTLQSPIVQSKGSSPECRRQASVQLRNAFLVSKIQGGTWTRNAEVFRISFHLHQHRPTRSRSDLLIDHKHRHVRRESCQNLKRPIASSHPRYERHDGTRCSNDGQPVDLVIDEIEPPDRSECHR